MAKYCGSGFLLLKGNEDGPPETFAQVGGMRSTGLTINGEQVDVTDKDDAKFRALLENCGIMSLSISLSGIITNDVKVTEIEDDHNDRLHKNYQVVSDRGDSYEGAFEVATFERSGETNAEETFSITLESTGAYVHTPAP